MKSHACSIEAFKDLDMTLHQGVGQNAKKDQQTGTLSDLKCSGSQCSLLSTENIHARVSAKVELIMR